MRLGNRRVLYTTDSGSLWPSSSLSASSSSFQLAQVHLSKHQSIPTRVRKLSVFFTNTWRLRSITSPSLENCNMLFRFFKKALMTYKCETITSHENGIRTVPLYGRNAANSAILQLRGRPPYGRERLGRFLQKMGNRPLEASIVYEGHAKGLS